MLNTEFLFLLNNFSFYMLGLSLVMIIIHSLLRYKVVSLWEIIFRWTILFSLGFINLYYFFLYITNSFPLSEMKDWALSPFQFEVAFAYLSLGLLGIMSFKGDRGFRFATVISGCFLWWGAALLFLYENFSTQTSFFNSNHAWILINLFIPLLLLLCFANLPLTKNSFKIG